MARYREDMNVNLSFEAIDAEVHIGHAFYEPQWLKGDRKLVFKVRLSLRESIRILPDEITFQRWTGRVAIVAGSDDVNRIESKEHIGFISYESARELSRDLPSAPASYSVEVVVSKTQFEEVLSATRLGRRPRLISISAKDMDYDWQPDGSGKKWDVSTHPSCQVFSITFNVPLIASVNGTDDASKELDNLFSPIHTQVKVLLDKLDAIAFSVVATRNVLRSLLWAVLLIGAIVVLFRFF